MYPERKYTYEIQWSEDDQEYVGTVLEFPGLSWLEPEQGRALEGITNLVAEVLEDMSSNNEPIPEPLGQRRYSGKFNVRVPKELHRDLVTASQRQGISLNNYVNSKLAGV